MLQFPGVEIITRNEAVLLPFYPRLVATTLLRMGYDEQQLFAGLPFGLGQLEEERFRLSIDQHEQFILRVIDLTGDVHFALRLNQALDAANTNLTILAIANSGQIARALQAITRYFKTITRVFSIEGVETGDKAVMDLRPHLEHPQVIYFAIAAFALFLDQFFAEPLQGGHLLQRVELSIPQPAGFSRVRASYPFDLAFDCPGTRIFFQRELLDAPMQQADTQTVRLLTEVSERQLQEAEAETSFVGRVKWLLVNRVASPPKLDDAARQLGISPRGLRRRLAESGTTFQSLLDEIRGKTAARLLRESDAPVSTIAYELGYGNPSDFARAFRKWTGTSPSAYRQS